MHCFFDTVYIRKILEYGRSFLEPRMLENTELGSILSTLNPKIPYIYTYTHSISLYILDGIYNIITVVNIASLMDNP
jgi:hypothetical protein